MSDDNPYASPQAELLDSPPDQWEGDVRDCWRDGTLLVVCPTTVLPYRCVKTNEPAVGKPIRMSCDRTPPVLVLVLMPTMCIFPPIILVFVVVALVCRWSFTVRLPLGRRWRSWRRRAYGVGVLGTIALVALLVWSGQRPAGQSWGATIVAMLGLLALIVWSAARSSVLRQYRTRRGYVWLKGAHADFLASLPDWPLERW